VLLALCPILVCHANNVQVKTHLQSRANAAIAVGHQHEHTGGMAGALRMIFVNHGFRGLWRGVTAAVMRVSVGSATQLATFSWTKEHIVMMQVQALNWCETPILTNKVSVCFFSASQESRYQQ